MIRAGHIDCMGEIRIVYKILVVNPEGKRQLRRSRHRWKRSIRMDIWDIM